MVSKKGGQAQPQTCLAEPLFLQNLPEVKVPAGKLRPPSQKLTHRSYAHHHLMSDKPLQKVCPEALGTCGEERSVWHDIFQRCTTGPAEHRNVLIPQDYKSYSSFQEISVLNSLAKDILCQKWS